MQRQKQRLFQQELRKSLFSGRITYKEKNRKFMIEKNIINDIAVFAETNYRGKRLKFGIKTDDRRRHIYIIGKTGMGKTTMLENMVFSDLVNGHALAVIDPHGDFAEKLLDFIPTRRINDVVYFNPADMEYPIAFNVMEQVKEEHRHLVASGLIGVFKKIWADSWGPRLEYVLRNAILALLEYPGSTLLGVPRILVDKNYRKKVVSKISDPVVKAFWVDEFSKYSNQFLVEAISPIQNKVGQFLSSSLVRNIVSQTKSAIDLRDIMDNNKILIINLAKGRIGEDYSALLGAMMITKIQLAAMGRVDISENERKDFYLYVDEFQNFATESFATILSEARKYRLNLTIAHQYVGQLVTDQNTAVRDAVFGNVGTLVAFRVGAQDAEFLEKEFEPVFTINDLVNLPKHHIYLKLMIDGVTSAPFSATTLPPLAKVSDFSARDKIIRSSRERYATDRKIIEEKIARWSGFAETNEKNDSALKSQKNHEEGLEMPQKNKIYKKDLNSTENNSKNRSESAKKEMFPAVCRKCGIDIKVPFEPDPKRSTYCKKCLREVKIAADKNPDNQPKPLNVPTQNKAAERPFDLLKKGNGKTAELEADMFRKPIPLFEVVNQKSLNNFRGDDFNKTETPLKKEERKTVDSKPKEAAPISISEAVKREPIYFNSKNQAELADNDLKNTDKKKTGEEKLSNKAIAEKPDFFPVKNKNQNNKPDKKIIKPGEKINLASG